MSRNKCVDRTHRKTKKRGTDWPLIVMEMFSRHPDNAVNTMLLSTAQTRQSVNTSCQHHPDLL